MIRMVIVYVGGIKGVGKSFIFRKIFSQLETNDLSYERAKVAEAMFELLRQQGLIRDYNELDTIGSEIRNKVRLQAFQEILMNAKQDLIFDGHYSIPTVFGYEYGIPLEIIKEIGYLVLLYNTPEVVLNRRGEDKSKRREADVEKGKLDLAVEEAFAQFYASRFGKKIIKIKTDDEATSKLINFLKEVSKKW